MKNYFFYLKLIPVVVLCMSILISLNGCNDDNNNTPPTPVAPTAPTLTSPTDKATGQSTKPTLKWQATETEGVEIKEYAVFLDTNSDPKTLMGTGTKTELSITTALKLEETYFWKVRVTDKNGQEATSPVFSFTTVGEEGFEISDIEFGKVLESKGLASKKGEKYILNMEEAAKVTKLDLGGGSKNPLDIKSIAGIQHFKALKELDVDYTNITDLDLSQNSTLDTLQFTNSATNQKNFLTTMKLPSEILRVRIFRHNLSDFDASGFPKLQYLRLDGDNIANEAVNGVTNVLATLKVDETKNKDLIHLDMGGNLDNNGKEITYEVSQALYDQLTDSGKRNKDGVTPPLSFSVSDVTPVNEAQDIAVDANIVVTFSSDVDQSTITYTLVDASDAPVASQLSVNGAVATIDPDANLSNDTEYTLSISAATGTNGKNIPETYSTSFTTIAATNITITGVTPTDNATQVVLGANISVEFSSDIDAGKVSYTLSDGNSNVASTLSANGTTLTINPDNDLAVETTYTLTITAAESTTGATLASTFTSTFKTINALQLQGIMSFQAGGTSSSGRDRAIHLRANVAIADLSIYGIGIPNNGGGTVGKEVSLPSMSISAGADIILIRNDDEAELTTYLGTCFSDFDVKLTDDSGKINFNGDDAVELYKNTTVIEIYGDADVDGTGQAWEYTGSWAYRQPDGSFNTGALNCTLNQTDNASSPCPYPFCSE